MSFKDVLTDHASVKGSENQSRISSNVIHELFSPEQALNRPSTQKVGTQDKFLFFAPLSEEKTATQIIAQGPRTSERSADACHISGSDSKDLGVIRRVNKDSPESKNCADQTGAVLRERTVNGRKVLAVDGAAAREQGFVVNQTGLASSTFAEINANQKKTETNSPAEFPGRFTGLTNTGKFRDLTPHSTDINFIDSGSDIFKPLNSAADTISRHNNRAPHALKDDRGEYRDHRAHRDQRQRGDHRDREDRKEREDRSEPRGRRDERDRDGDKDFNPGRLWEEIKRHLPELLDWLKRHDRRDHMPPGDYCPRPRPPRDNPPPPNPLPPPNDNPIPPPNPLPPHDNPVPPPNPLPPNDNPVPPSDKPVPPSDNKPPSADLQSASERFNTAAGKLDSTNQQDLKTARDEMIKGCRARGLSDSEIAKTLDQTSRLLETKSTVVPAADEAQARIAAAEGILKNASQPDFYVNQGGHNTCNVTTVEERSFNNNPSRAAQIVADSVLTGHYKSLDGREVTLHPDALRPDSEARRNQLQGENVRSYTSQIFQSAVLTDLGSRNNPPVQYIANGGPGASGEGWITPSGQKYGFNGTTLQEIVEMNQFVNGDSNVVAAGFSSPQELESWIKENAGKQPLIIGVNGNDPLFYGDHTRSDGTTGGLNHVVSIREYDAANHRVRVSNQWGSSMDFWVDINLLHQAT